MKNIISALHKRYATKHFDPEFKLTTEQEQSIKDIIRLSPSSMGIQPYEVILVKDQTMKETLSPAGFNQAQIRSSSMIVVFAVGDPIEKGWFDKQANLLIEQRHVPKAKAHAYMDGFKKNFELMSSEQRLIWATHQAYLALGNVLTALAIEGLDACPMEGFDKDAFDELLNLKSRNLTSVVMLTIGQRSAEDSTQFQSKVRKSDEDLFSYAMAQSPQWN